MSQSHQYKGTTGAAGVAATGPPRDAMGVALAAALAAAASVAASAGSGSTAPPRAASATGTSGNRSGIGARPAHHHMDVPECC